MNVKKSFSSLFGTLVLMTLFVSCSSNEDRTMTTTANPKVFRSATVANPPHGSLKIVNNTNYTFKDQLMAWNDLNANGNLYRLFQKVVIYPNSDVTLSNYHDTYTKGIDYDGTDKWETLTGTSSSSVTGTYASASNSDHIHYMVDYLTPDNYYVQWGAMNAKSTDGMVSMSFKINYGDGSIEVNPDQDNDGLTFSTTADVDENGNTTIAFNEN